MSDPDAGPDALPLLRPEEVADLPADHHVTYRKIGRMLGELGEMSPPPSDVWRQRVLGALAAQRKDRARRLRTWTIGLGLAAIVTIGLFVALRPTPATEPSLVAQIVASGEQHLGDSGSGIAYRNDKLIVRAAAAGPAEIRVYDERGGLVGRCGDEPVAGCTAENERGGRAYRLELKLERLGTIRIVFLIGEHIPAPAVGMDEDLDAARGLRILTAAPIKVL